MESPNATPRERLIELGARIASNDGRLSAESSFELDYCYDEFDAALNEYLADALDEIAEHVTSLALSGRSDAYVSQVRAVADRIRPSAILQDGEYVKVFHQHEDGTEYEGGITKCACDPACDPAADYDGNEHIEYYG